MTKRILVTGGAGYAGAVLAPRLLEAGYGVTVLDLYLYGDDVLDSVSDNPHLIQLKGDIRDRAIIQKALEGCDAVIHLACISNDPSFELDPELGRSINFDAFEPLVKMSREAGVGRFIYASSSSVYGIKDTDNVDETASREPLTDYSKYKALCEDVLLEHNGAGFTGIVLRPATICGYSPRQRLDLTVNILTNHAVNTGTIRVFGGSQLRPNIHINDMADAYLALLEAPAELVGGECFNAGYENHPVAELAEIVRSVVGRERVDIVTEPTDDIRSYHISSGKIAETIGFRPKRSIEDAVSGLVEAFESGLLPDSMTDSRYFNIKKMQEVDLR